MHKVCCIWALLLLLAAEPVEPRFQGRTERAPVTWSEGHAESHAKVAAVHRRHIRIARQGSLGSGRIAPAIASEDTFGADEASLPAAVQPSDGPVAFFQVSEVGASEEAAAGTGASADSVEAEGDGLGGAAAAGGTAAAKAPADGPTADDAGGGDSAGIAFDVDQGATRLWPLPLPRRPSGKFLPSAEVRAEHEEMQGGKGGVSSGNGLVTLAEFAGRPPPATEETRLPVCGLALIACFALLCGVAFFGRGLLLQLLPRRPAEVDLGPAWRLAESLPVRCTAELDEILPPAEPHYDCPIILKPVRSKTLLRLEARVTRATGGAEVTAPLTKKSCVFYSAAASKELHDGVQNFPLAFSMASVDFCVSLLDAPDVEIQIQGSDISMFGMLQGSFREQRRADAIPPSFQEFMAVNRTFPHPSFNVRSVRTVLDFQECCLCVGAVITAVGELHRTPDGVLSLRPLALDGLQHAQDADLLSALEVSGLAQDHRHGGKEQPRVQQQAQPPAWHADRVLISDHPRLRHAEEKPRPPRARPARGPKAQVAVRDAAKMVLAPAPVKMVPPGKMEAAALAGVQARVCAAGGDGGTGGYPPCPG